MKNRKVTGCALALVGFLGLAGMIIGLVLLFTESVGGFTVIIIETVSLLVLLVSTWLGKFYMKKAPPEEIELRKKVMEDMDAVKHPDAHKKALAEGGLYAYGALNCFIGIITLIFGIEIFEDMGLGVVQIVAGVILLLLAYMTGKKYILAVILAVIIIAADLAGLIYAYAANRSLFFDFDSLSPFVLAGGVLGIIIHIVMLRTLVPAIKAIHNLKKAAKAVPPPAPPQ